MKGQIKSTTGSSDRIVEDFQFKQDYEMVAKSFSLEILREHYNTNGEYFVLCSIVPDSASKSLFRKRWGYTTDETGNVRISSIAGLRLNDRGALHIMQYLFDFNADSGTTHRIISVNKNPIWTSKKPMSETRSNFFDGSDLPIGAEQTRALSSLPLLPDFITVVQNTRGYWLNDDWLGQVSLDSRGAGMSNPMQLKFVLLDNGRLQTNIVERFPDVIDGYDELRDKKFKEKHGFSMKYLASKETIEREIISVLGVYESPFWEIAKNNGLLMALSEAMNDYSIIIKETNINKEENYSVRNEEAELDSYK